MRFLSLSNILIASIGLLSLSAYADQSSAGGEELDIEVVFKPEEVSIVAMPCLIIMLLHRG